jgi:hypothetical protein
MRKLVTVVALATALASPALAQSYTPEVGTGNIAPPPAGQIARGIPNGAAGAYALRAYARVPAAGAYAPAVRPSATSDQHDVTQGGRTFGRDPDPFIRSQMLRLRGMGYAG